MASCLASATPNAGACRNAGGDGAGASFRTALTSTSTSSSSSSSSTWTFQESPFLQKLGKGVPHATPRQLLAYCNGLLLAWSESNRSLYAVEATEASNSHHNECYELIPSHKISFRVDFLLASLSGYLLVWGPDGAVVVTVPHHDSLSGNSSNNNDGNAIRCKSWPVGELLLMQVPSLEILALQWLPGSSTEVAMLTSDNCLRRFDISKKNTRALTTVQVLQRAASLSRMSFSMASATGSQIVDFAFGRSADEVFCLTSSGLVHRISGFLASADHSAPRVSERPLMMLPDHEDNFGSDGFAILSLDYADSACTVLVLGGSDGFVYHCVVLPTANGDDDPQIYVVEQVKLSLTLLNSADSSDDIRSPVILQRDPSLANRYFIHHDSGVHVVILSFAERLLKFIQQDEADVSTLVLDSEDGGCNSGPPGGSGSLVEQVVCTRANDVVALDAPPGVCVMPGLPSPWLAVLTAEPKIIHIPLNRYRFSTRTFRHSLLVEEPPSERPALELVPMDFEREIRVILTGSRMPLLAQTKKVTNPKDLLELTLQTTQRFREQHLARLIAVRRLIEEKSSALREEKQSQLSEMDTLASAVAEAVERSKKLSEKVASMEADKRKLMLRLHDVIQTVQRKNPSATNPKMLQEVSALCTRVQRLESALESTRMRSLEWGDLKRFEGLTDNELLDTRDTIGALSETQRSALQNKLQYNGQEIGKMVRTFKELLVDME